MELLVWLFNDFETLDAFGPVEVLGKLPGPTEIRFISLHGGIVTSAQRVPVVTERYDLRRPGEGFILLIPGGMGTRKEIDHEPLLQALGQLARSAGHILAVCTGAALLAKTGLLDRKEATSNKLAFDWVAGQGPDVQWVRKARWVRAGNIYTSSGVSAGIDMALGFVADQCGSGAAERIAAGIEYLWNRDRAADPFWNAAAPKPV